MTAARRRSAPNDAYAEQPERPSPTSGAGAAECATPPALVREPRRSYGVGARRPDAAMTAQLVRWPWRVPQKGFPPLLADGVVVLFAFVFSAVYDVYRYPLRINAAATSPTYQNTPAPLSAGKYVVLALLGVYLVLRVRPRWLAVKPADRRQGMLLLLIGWLGLALLLHTLAARSSQPLDRLAPVAFVLPFAYLVGQPAIVSRAQVQALVPWLQAGVLLLTAANAAVDLLELLLFQFTGRLPALGYAGSLTRFGGIWDDPNSAGTFAALVLVALASGRHGLTRRTALAIAGCAAFCLLLSWSFSATVVLAVGVTATLAARFRRQPRLILAALAVVALCTAAAVTVALDASAVPLFGRDLQVKLAGSVQSRQDDLAQGRYLADHPHTPWEWLAGRDRPPPNEAAAVQWLNTAGLAGLLLFAVWIGWMTAALRSGTFWPRSLAIVLALCAGSMFVPYLGIFPISAFFFVGLAVAGAAARGDPRPYARAATTADDAGDNTGADRFSPRPSAGGNRASSRG